MTHTYNINSGVLRKGACNVTMLIDREVPGEGVCNVTMMIDRGVPGDGNHDESG